MHRWQRLASNGRPPTLALRGAVASNDTLTCSAGLNTLLKGGNAADAAISMAASLQFTWPAEAGMGGDCFGLFYNASTKMVHSINGSGKSPARLTLELLNSKGFGRELDVGHRGLLVTVPGAVKGWFDILRNFGSGKLAMAELLEPAIRFGEEGVPVSNEIAREWKRKLSKLRKMHGGGAFLKPNGNTPSPREVWRNPAAAELLKEIGKKGANAFYAGPVASAIVDAVERAGGVLTLEDLRDHVECSESAISPSISTTYRSAKVHTPPLPSQGAILLEALNILENLDLAATTKNPAEFYHLLIEALRLAFDDGFACIGDPVSGSIETMIDKSHAVRRSELFLDREGVRASSCPVEYPTLAQSGTVFTAAVDALGNACALLSSNMDMFGSTVVQSYGFAIQSRAAGFNAAPGHPNCAGPRRVPFHSLMPVMVTDASTGEWMAAMGTMGGLTSPQIILQAFLSMMELGLDPQAALDLPRILIGRFHKVHPDDPLTVEAGFDLETLNGLLQKGHVLKDILKKGENDYAGLAHIIGRASCWKRCAEDETSGQDLRSNRVLWCGADSRGGGVAIGF